MIKNHEKRAKNDQKWAKSGVFGNKLPLAQPTRARSANAQKVPLRFGLTIDW